MSKGKAIDIETLPEEPLGKPIPFLSNYYLCPKCRGSVEGEFGLTDKQGKVWCLSRCEKCGYTYKVRVDLKF